MVPAGNKGNIEDTYENLIFVEDKKHQHDTKSIFLWPLREFAAILHPNSYPFKGLFSKHPGPLKKGSVDYGLYHLFGEVAVSVVSTV